MDNPIKIKPQIYESKEVQQKIFDERLKILHQNLLVGIPSNFISSLLIYFGLFRVESHFVFLIWLMAILIHSVLRFCEYFLYRKSPERRQFHLTLFLIGVAITGLLWGILGSLLIPQDDVLHQLIIIIVITVIASGALQTLQASFAASVIFVTLNILPLSVWLFLQYQYEYVVGGVIMLTYLCFMIAIAKRNYNLIISTLELRFENLELVRHLSKFNKKLNKSNNSLQQAQEELKNIAYHDNLTGLANRKLLQILFESAKNFADRNKKEIAICFLDLDEFKPINDQYGHDVGDIVLKAVASRLQNVVRKTDTVARLGGDEFILLITALPSIAELLKIINKIEDIFSKPIILQDQLIKIRFSMGICIYPKDGQDLRTLIRNADKALYQVKEKGGNNYHFYE